MAAFVLLVVCILAYGFGETYWTQVKEYTFTDADIPAEFDGTRIVFLTDIHRSMFFSQDRVRRLVDRVNALEPDLIVLGGDYVYKDTAYAGSCLVELGKLQAPLGRFAVLGNHDYGKYDEPGSGGPRLVIDAINDAGITLLRDQGAWVEKGAARIRVGGVNDYSVDRPQIASIIEGTVSSDFVILASHDPDYAERLPADAIDLVLSGHTHGGQVTFFGFWAPHVPSDYGQKYRTGLVENEVTTVIVSNGVGTSTIPPIRLFARPQIVVITLRSVLPASLHQ